MLCIIYIYMLHVYITWIPPIQPWVPYSTHTKIWEHRYCHSAPPPFLNIWIQTCTFVIVYFYKNLCACISAWKSQFKSSNSHAGMQTPLIPQPPHHPTQSTYVPHLTLIRRPPPHPTPPKHKGLNFLVWHETGETLQKTLDWPASM